MPRALHSDTQVQRAESADAVPSEARERGYEASDARPRLVLLGVAFALVALVTGLAGAGLTLGWLQATGDAPPPRRPAPVAASSPRLLVHPADERMNYDRQVRARVPQADIGRAAREVAGLGWDTAPALSPRETASEHAEPPR